MPDRAELVSVQARGAVRPVSSPGTVTDPFAATEEANSRIITSALEARSATVERFGEDFKL